MFALGVICCLIGIGLILLGAKENKKPSGSSITSQDSFNTDQDD